MKAFAWKDGTICFGARTPPEALQLCDAPAEDVRVVIMGTADLGANGVSWVVPGMAEADGELERVNAVIKFRAQIDVRLKQLELVPVGRAA